jgi:hypothetical protein
MINKRLNQIIVNCQQLRDKYGFNYEEECSEIIERFSKEIIEKELIANSKDKDFAMQLCIMNSLKFHAA